jgi:hypothetical protein
MKKISILLLLLVTLLGAPLSAQPSSRGWGVKLQVNSRFQFHLRMQCNTSHGATLYAVRLQILQAEPTEQLLICFEIGERPHA